MKKEEKIYSYQINLVPEKEGGYTVLVPLLPGCISYGKTVEEATKNAKEAIELHLENLIAHKQSVPREDEKFPVFNALIQIIPSHAR
ncbi:MAG: type II toxin-antitoxin system HicB family antitoxin [Candidatus Paceibacterota bacterium]